MTRKHAYIAAVALPYLVWLASIINEDLAVAAGFSGAIALALWFFFSENSPLDD